MIQAPMKTKIDVFQGVANWAKMKSPWGGGKLTAMPCHPTKSKHSSGSKLGGWKPTYLTSANFYI